MAVILAAVVGALFLAIPGSPIYRAPTKGLDLQGGLEVILEAVPRKGQTINTAQMQTAQDIMERRANETGLSSPNVALQGYNQIVIQLAGIHNPAKAAAIIGSTGQLQFFDFEKDLLKPTVSSSGNPTPYPTLYSLLTAVKSRASKGTPEGYYLFGDKTRPVFKDGKRTKKTRTIKNAVLTGPYPKQKQLLAQYHGKQPPDTTILAIPANTEVVFQKVTPTSGLTTGTQPVKVSPDNTYWYLFKYFPDRTEGPPEITGNDLDESAITA